MQIDRDLIEKVVIILLNYLEIMSNVLPFNNTVRPQGELNHNYQPSPRKKKALAAASKGQPPAPTSNNENKQLPPKPLSHGIGVDALLADILAAEDSVGFIFINVNSFCYNWILVWTVGTCDTQKSI